MSTRSLVDVWDAIKVLPSRPSWLQELRILEAGKEGNLLIS
jgi:hypothetical protein